MDALTGALSGYIAALGRGELEPFPAGLVCGAFDQVVEMVEGPRRTTVASVLVKEHDREWTVNLILRRYH